MFILVIPLVVETALITIFGIGMNIIGFAVNGNSEFIPANVVDINTIQLRNALFQKVIVIHDMNPRGITCNCAQRLLCINHGVLIHDGSGQEGSSAIIGFRPCDELISCCNFVISGVVGHVVAKGVAMVNKFHIIECVIVAAGTVFLIVEIDNVEVVMVKLDDIVMVIPRFASLDAAQVLGVYLLCLIFAAIVIGDDQLSDVPGLDF